MKVLLDENLPHDPRHEIAGHDVYTTAYMGWSGIENGDLLALAAKSGFRAFITKDLGMEYQLSPASVPLAVIVLHSVDNSIEAIRPLLPSIVSALSAATRGRIVHVP